MSRTEDALQALLSVLQAAAGDALPEAVRNMALNDGLDALDAGKSGFLNVVDGDGAVIETQLGNPPVYEIEHTASVEWIVKANTDADRETSFDAGLEAIDDAIAADPTLGSVVSDTQIVAVNRSNLAIEGMPQFKGAEISVRLVFTSSRPF